MSDGIVKDEIIGSNYPDALSINYLNIKLSSKPGAKRVTESDCVSFWNTVSGFYGGCFYDDIVLTINGVPHRNFLENGDKIYFPAEKDIKKSFAKERE